MPAPSAITNPSRSRSNGRLARCGSSLRRDIALITVNAPYTSGESGASTPPAIAARVSPRAMAAVAKLANAHIYVDDDHAELRTRLGERYGLTKDHVIVGHGSNDVFMTLFATFVRSVNTIPAPSVRVRSPTRSS